MKSIQILLFAVMVASMVNCKKNDDVPRLNKSDAKEITSFVFKAVENEALNVNVTGTIDENAKTIMVVLPSATDVSALVPEITVSEKASITPDGPVNFSYPVKFKVTAEDESTIDYEVVVHVLSSSEMQLIEFRFEGIVSEGANVVVIATIDEENKTIRATMPAGTDISDLTPEIELSQEAVFEPQGPQDFSDTVAYTVTAEDDSSTTYEVFIDVVLTEKEILLKIADVNGIKIMNWDEETDLSNFEGVQLNSDNKVVQLAIDGPRINNLPTEIGRLESLKFLYIVQTDLASLPPEIGQLISLEKFILFGNKLSSLPSNIGLLVNLKELNLNNNMLTELPSEIGRLSGLEKLSLEANKLAGLPSQIGQLESLQSLNLSDNYISILPTEIGRLANLINLSVINNKLNTIPLELGQLTALGFLSLSSNELATIPKDIGQLTNLIHLDIRFNMLTSLPQEIGQLSSLKDLYLNDNQLVSPPREIGNLPNLISLTLEDNGIVILDGNICDLERNGPVDIDIYPGVDCSTE